jgi:hypothetical protein
MIKFSIGGRSVTPNNMGDALQSALLASIEEDLCTKIGSIRDPETGEFPLVVVKGRDIEHLSISVEGSAKVIELVTARLGLNETEGEEGPKEGERPVAFLCHASEDKNVVRRLANDLMAHGVEVFFDEWEIRGGDSLRQKIDAGLDRCTHFVAVLSPTSICKPWVNSEMDAGFVMRLQQQVVFIPLRLGLDVAGLPPLLRGIAAPAIDNYEADLPALISDIHGVTRKPPLGPRPAVKTVATAGIGLSPAAESIVRLLVTRSEHGDAHDPRVDVEELEKATRLTEDDLADAVDELVGQGYVGKHIHCGCGEIGFAKIYPEGELFAKFDDHFMPWRPSEDALVLATKALESPGGWLPVVPTATLLGWQPRRMNPALNYLMNRALADFGGEVGTHPWSAIGFQSNHATRRLARGRARPARPGAPSGLGTATDPPAAE